MTWLDRMILRMLAVALIGYLVGHWQPTPTITLTTPKQTIIKREVYAGLPPMGGMERPGR